MDITALVNDVTASMVPLLPYLFKAGESAAEEAGKNLAGAAWEEVKKLWGMLRPRIEAKPAALEAAHEASMAPEDEDTQAALRLQLKKLFTEDANLAQSVHDWLESTSLTRIDVSSSGSRNVAIGGDVKKSTIVTGNRNSVKA